MMNIEDMAYAIYCAAMRFLSIKPCAWCDLGENVQHVYVAYAIAALEYLNERNLLNERMKEGVIP